jgi:XapX domain-containing protein
VKEIVLALFAGLIVGGFFSILRLPIPAPQNIAGVMGIFGIFLGYLIVKLILK